MDVLRVYDNSLTKSLVGGGNSLHPKNQSKNISGLLDKDSLRNPSDGMFLAS